MIRFHALFARKHGADEGYPVLASFGDELAVLRKYDELTAPAAQPFRDAHAELQLIRDGKVVWHLHFPDPSVIETARRDQALTEARAAKAEFDRAKADHEAARAALEAAHGGLKVLTDEQKKLLAEAEVSSKAAEETAAARAQAAQDEADAAAKESAAAAFARTAQSQAAVVDGLFVLSSATVPAAVPLPSLDELIKLGYAEDVAKTIVARQAAMAEAFAKNPQLTKGELQAIAVAIDPAAPFVEI